MRRPHSLCGAPTENLPRGFPCFPDATRGDTVGGFSGKGFSYGCIMGCLLRGKFRLGWEGRSAGSGRRLSAPAPEGEHVPRAATPPSSRDCWRRWAGWHSLRLNPGWARTRPADPIWAGGTQPYTGRVRSILCHAAWDDAGNKVFSHRAQVTFADSGVAAPRRFEDPLKATQATLGRQCRWERERTRIYCASVVEG